MSLHDRQIRLGRSSPPPCRCFRWHGKPIWTLRDQSSHVVEFYSRVVKSGDQLAYYTSGIGTFVTPSSSTRRLRMCIKNKWASVAARNFNSNLLS
ncbi:hypothetical protein EI94DRAFT_1746981 [Lactarius quietus]|nr:hypothetical protein EI94DRAFT_1746981 [Lactarius quietus]